MSGEQRIPVYVSEADRALIAYWAPPGLTPRQYLERLIHEAAQNLDPIPKPRRTPRPMSQYRAESRERNGGKSAYTAAIDIIPTRKDPA